MCVHARVKIDPQTFPSFVCSARNGESYAALRRTVSPGPIRRPFALSPSSSSSSTLRCVFGYRTRCHEHGLSNGSLPGTKAEGNEEAR